MFLCVWFHLIVAAAAAACLYYLQLFAQTCMQPGLMLPNDLPGIYQKSELLKSNTSPPPSPDAVQQAWIKDTFRDQFALSWWTSTKLAIKRQVKH